MQYLPAADLVVVMRGGTIAEVGTYEELSARGVDFSTVVKTAEDEATGQVVLTPVEERPAPPLAAVAKKCEVVAVAVPGSGQQENEITDRPSEAGSAPSPAVKDSSDAPSPDNADASTMADLGSAGGSSLPKRGSLNDLIKGRSTGSAGGMS